MSATSFSLSGNWTWSGPLPPEINGRFFGVWKVQHQVLMSVHKVPNWVPVFPLTFFPNATTDTSESKFLKKLEESRCRSCSEGWNVYRVNRKGNRTVSCRSPVVHRTHSVDWQFNTPSLRQQALTPPESFSSSNVCFYEHFLDVQKYCCCKQIYTLTKKKKAMDRKCVSNGTDAWVWQRILQLRDICIYIHMPCNVSQSTSLLAT